MRLTRVVLEKPGATVVIQGMVHMGPRSLYRKIQHEVNEADKRGHQIFFEGVNRRKEQIPARTQNEKNIRKFLTLLLEYYPTYGGAFGLGVQRKHVRYPCHAINADIDFSHLTKKLDENGFTCDSDLELLESMPNKKDVVRILKEYKKRKQKIPLLQAVIRWCYRHIIYPFQFRKATPVMIGYRNEFAVAKILTYVELQNALVHYGQEHVPGMVRLFKKAGWRVRQTTRQEVHSLDREL